MIKFWSYKKEFQKNKKEILLNIKKTMNSGNIFFGNQLINLEKNFTKKYNSKYGIAVGSGTDALLISLKAIGVKRGDEVITVANTAIPTISAIINSGAKPRLVDINNDYFMNVWISSVTYHVFLFFFHLKRLLIYVFPQGVFWLHF